MVMGEANVAFLAFLRRSRLVMFLVSDPLSTNP